jgi:hypothetical protein
VFRPLALLTFAAGLAGAQTGRGNDAEFTRLPGPVLRIRDSVSIDVKAAKLDPPYSLFALPRGRVLVAGSYMAPIAGFDSMGRRIWTKTPRGGSEIADVVATGWVGNQVWLADRVFQQVALIDEYGNVTKSLELPDFVRPTFSNRKNFPVFGSLNVLALYPDNSMLVSPRRPKELTTTSGYDNNSLYILRVSEDGIIQRQLAKVPAQTISIMMRGEKRTIDNPIYRQQYRVSGDGTLIVTVAIDTTSPKRDSITVRGINDRGDTVYTQRFGYPALRYTETQIDSVLRSRFGSSLETRDSVSRLLPRRMSAVTDFLMDVDGSVWLMMRPNGGSRSLVGIDRAGRFIGKFQIDMKRSIKAADRGRLWVGDYRDMDRRPIVRYTLAK